MQPDPKTELTRQWLQTASEDLALADLALRASPPLLSGAVYHCQQAFEKTLKAFLTWQAFPFQPTHDLPTLVRLCEPVDPAFAALANDAALVTPYATQFRYPPLLVPPTAPDAADALRAAREAFEGISNYLKRVALRNVCCSSLQHLLKAAIRLCRKPRVIQGCVREAGYHV